MTGNPQPLGGNELPRFAGIATFMRLPGRSHPSDLDVAVVGVPFDIGTSNRPGARFGPRGIRDESVLIRPYNMATRAAPFDSLRIDDTGDVATNPYNLLDSVTRIEAHFDELLSHGVITVALGGDHTIVLPILRAVRARHGPVGLVHVDAHTDINDEMFGERIAHGTPFRRAVEEGLLDCDRVVQIGMRATGYGAHRHGHLLAGRGQHHMEHPRPQLLQRQVGQLDIHRAALGFREHRSCLARSHLAQPERLSEGFDPFRLHPFDQHRRLLRTCAGRCRPVASGRGVARSCSLRSRAARAPASPA